MGSSVSRFFTAILSVWVCRGSLGIIEYERLNTLPIYIENIMNWTLPLVTGFLPCCAL